MRRTYVIMFTPIRGGVVIRRTECVKRGTSIDHNIHLQSKMGSSQTSTSALASPTFTHPTTSASQTIYACAASLTSVRRMIIRTSYSKSEHVPRISMRVAAGHRELALVALDRRERAVVRFGIRHGQGSQQKAPRMHPLRLCSCFWFLLQLLQHYFLPHIYTPHRFIGLEC